MPGRIVQAREYSNMTRIYLADLTHTTITVSNDSFPLNIGMVAAYAKAQFPELEITLFKYPDELMAALKQQLPDIIGLSNYPWNLNLGSACLNYVKAQSPDVITVMGGPNMPYGTRDQQELLNKIGPSLDFYCLYEGEAAFVEVVKSAFDKGFNITAMKADQPAGTLYMNHGTLIPYRPIPRMKELDSYPSPYQSGILDKFFDDTLSPMIETHRGCPFRCTYCHEGDTSYTKINRFSTERIKADLGYIARNIGTKVTNLLIADPNFGVFPRDVELADELAAIRRQYGYPKTLFATTAKNVSERIITLSERLKDVSMPIWMSVQSLNEVVLDKIRRRNIKLSAMIEVQQQLAKLNAITKSELILSLPGETLASHIDALVRLIELKIDYIACYQLMIVNGSEIMSDILASNDPALKTAFRVLPRSFTEMEGLGRVIEVEEIVIATRDMPYEDYLKARRMHLLISIFYNGKAFEGFFRLANEWQISLELFLSHLLELFSASTAFSSFVTSFQAETIDELFPTEQALTDYFASDENFQQLHDGSRGSNLLQKYTCTAYMYHATDLVQLISDCLIKTGPTATEFNAQQIDLTTYYQLLFAEYLNPERNGITTRGTFYYDITAWLEGDLTLGHFKECQAFELDFTTSIERFDLLEGYLDRLGRSVQSLGKIMTRLWLPEIFRQPSRSAPSP